MTKIQFQNNQEPALSAEILNQLQDNIDSEKQDELTAGQNIEILNNVVGLKRTTPVYKGDLNDVNYTSMYYIDGTVLNNPGVNGWCITLPLNDDYIKQIYFGYNTLNLMYERVKYNGVWSNWVNSQTK